MEEVLDFGWHGFWLAWSMAPVRTSIFSSLIHGPRENLDFFQLDPRPGDKIKNNARLGSQTTPKSLHGVAFPIFSSMDAI